MNAGDLMAKALRAISSAEVLLADGDGDGACNRAYYGMFDAARAALLAQAAPVPAEIAKTHSGLIAAFSQHLVKTGLVPVELGRALNKVEDLRLIADYKGDPVEGRHAAWAVAEAKVFVQAMQVLVPEKKAIIEHGRLAKQWNALPGKGQCTGNIVALSAEEVIQDTGRGRYVVWDRSRLTDADLVIGKNVTIYETGKVVQKKPSPSLGR